MISPKKEIVQLVLSLDAKEKRYFKRSFGGTKDYILLFDYIATYKEYNVPDIIDYIHKKNKKSKRPTSGYISVVRKNLKTKILSALRNLYSSQKKSYDLLTRSMNIDILLDKGLHAVAKQELNEAKDAFLKSGFPVERLLLLRRESLLQYYENYKFASIADIEQVYNHRILAAEQLVLEVKLARILSLLSYYYHSGSQKIEEIFKIQNEFLQSDYSEAREFSTQYLYCWIQAQIEEFKGNPAGSFLYFEKTMSLWFDNQIYIDAHPRMYLGTCFTYLKYMLQQKSLNSDLLARVNFDELLNKLNSSNLSTENVLQYAQIFNATKFLRLCINQKFEQVNATIGPVLHKFFREDQATDFYQIMISFLAAVAAFESDDFKKAEKYIQRVYPSQTIDISKNPEYEYDVLLLHLIIQFELGNMRYLKLQLEYCKNYINSKDKKEGIENLLIELLGKLISKRYQDNKRLVLDRYKNRMNEIAAANKLSSQFKHNVYMNWIERNLRKSL